ncbi:hypothetical protein THAR02_10942 [Trichoderma harzianum]|uniref:Uncharacterized protein n=1 Tax=Trichoderma harzianum TaxID=5544 RepID=A0A0F9WWT6_TRIHA|nr:hypothetical protein THAR02_10942 [Trichoderma harzianum]
MSGLYYVLVKWAPVKHSNDAILTRNILHFSSRYDADEFYREIQVLQYNNAPYFTRLVRSSPQFWCYDSAQVQEAIHRLFLWNLVSKFKDVVSFANANQAQWNSSSNSVTGPDWVGGGSYFIRNRRQPNLYWWVHDTHIHTSEQRRTKFRIQQVIHSDSGSGCCPPVLIRKDKITVDVIPETVTSGAVAGGTQFVSIRNSNSNCLTLTNKPHDWTFEELINKQVGVRWGNEIPEEKGQARPLLVFMPNGGGDEWELC